MNLHQHLISRAERQWAAHGFLELDLFYEMLGAGIDVDAAEREFFARDVQQHQYMETTQ